MFDFHMLEMKYGAPTAHWMLLEIEKAARIKPSEHTVFDSEARLADALRAQDAEAKAA